MLSSSAKKFFKNLPNDINVTVAMNMDELRSRRYNKFVRSLIKKDEHSFVFRFPQKYDGRKFSKLSAKKLAFSAKRAKSLFKKNYNYNLKYVFFPYVTHNTKKQVAAVEKAGFKVFGHNLYVKKNFRRNGKGKIVKQIKKFAKQKKGVIVYHDAHNTRLNSDRSWVEHKLTSRKYNIVSLDQCFASESESSSSDDEEAPVVAPVDENADNAQKAAVVKAPEDETKEKENSATGLKASLVGVAAVVLMLIL